MKRIDLNAGVKMRIHNMPALWKSVHVFELGCALALVAGSEPATCRAEEATTNAVALTMHSIIVPEIHCRDACGSRGRSPSRCCKVSGSYA